MECLKSHNEILKRLEKKKKEKNEDFDPGSAREKRGVDRSVTRRYAALVVGGGLTVGEKSEVCKTG